MAHALGLKASVVELALYDLSQGVAQWIPASLLGALAKTCLRPRGFGRFGAKTGLQPSVLLFKTGKQERLGEPLLFGAVVWGSERVFLVVKT